MTADQLRDVLTRYPDLRAGVTHHMDEIVRIAARILEGERRPRERLPWAGLSDLERASVRHRLGKRMSRKRVESGFHINGPAPLARPGPGNGGISSDATPTLFTAAEVARLWRDTMKDKSYRAFPMASRRATISGRSGSGSRRRPTATTSPASTSLPAISPTSRSATWSRRSGRSAWRSSSRRSGARAQAAPTTRTSAILRDFFKFHVLRGNLHGDPTLAIERARKRDVYRTTFNSDQVRAIVASQDELRDRVAVRLLLNYGLRKGALRAIQFKHFDHHRKRLTVFTKGEKVRELPIPTRISGSTSSG